MVRFENLSFYLSRRHPEGPRFHQRAKSLPLAKSKGISRKRTAVRAKLHHYQE